MKNLTIHIYKASDDDGYYYDLYDCPPEEVGDVGIESIDGGFCTTTLKNAIEMATEQAKDLIVDNK